MPLHESPDLFIPEQTGPGKAKNVIFALPPAIRERLKFSTFPYLFLLLLLAFGVQAEESQPEWDRLNEQVMTLFASASYEAALEPATQALQLARQRHGPEHQDVALALNNLAALHDRLGGYAKAELIYKEALAIKERLLGPDDLDVALSLNNLAALYKTQARYQEAAPLYQRALAIKKRQLGPNDPDIALSLNNLAQLHDIQGEADKAEPLYQRSLAIREQAFGPGHPSVALALNNLAAFHYNQGDYARAEPLYQRALNIREETLGPQHPDVALSLNNLAVLYRAQGDYARARALYQRALAIDEQAYGPEHPELATDLNNLAVLYDILGKAAEAEPLYRRALAILEQALGQTHPRIAEALNNLALLYKTQGDYARATPLYERGLAILEQSYDPRHPAVATALNNLAVLYDNQGQHEKAEPLLERALAIRQQAFGSRHPLVGNSLNNLAELHRAQGRDDKAKALYLEAWWIGLEAGNPQFLADVLDNLSRFLAVQGKTQAAILLGKEAVNSLQGLRGNVAGLGKETLKGFDASIEDVYRHLARLLLEAGRLPEAERALQLFKEQEQFEFLRRDASSELLSGSMPLTGLEAAQRKRLLESKDARAFQQGFAELLAAFEGPGQQSVSGLVRPGQDIQAGLQRLRQTRGELVAALYTIADKEDYGLILVTADERRAYWARLEPDELKRRIVRFRALIQDRSYDARAEGRALLDIILPLEARKELERLGITSLLWHLDGPLRLLPLAALHDGSRYLIERYRLATFMATDLTALLESRQPDWTGLGFGVSQNREVDGQVFSALPAVPEELRTVIRTEDGQHPSTGVIPGHYYLDKAFDWPGFKRHLQQDKGHPLLHIASHFNLEPGNETRSYLLTGQGEPISLALLNSQQQLLDGVELITLSACNTAVAPGQDAQGREVDGLAFIAQRQGASSVLATLWPVADEATARLMAHFYRLLKQQRLGKAEALRQAQLSLLGRGQGTDESHPYAHPFFWAPFVLMGNWQ